MSHSFNITGPSALEALKKGAIRATKAMKNFSKVSNRIPSKKKTGRNDPCPCGSGKKHKRCCR